MNRRWLLWQASCGGALVLGVGGLLYLQEQQRARKEQQRARERELELARRRAEFTSRMLDDALPSLASNSLRELNTLPVKAREEIRRYIHGKCLNVEGFVSHICSDEFTERLGRCHTQDEREVCFLQAFCGRVATEAEILNQVETIAADVGSELDSGWAAYCTELSGRWNTRIQGYSSPLSMDELNNRLGSMIRTEIAQAARQAVYGNRSPAVGETIGKIGASAVLLLPLVRFGKIGLAVGIPVFVILAAKHLWDYVTARLEDRRGDYEACRWHLSVRNAG